MTFLLEHTRRPDITFRHSGRISISARVVRMLALRPGDSINFSIDGGEHFLLAVRHSDASGRHFACCRRANPGSNYLVASSVRISRYFLDLCGARRRVSLPCGEPVASASGNISVPLIVKLILDRQ